MRFDIFDRFVFASGEDSHEVTAADVNRGPCRNHLQLNTDTAQMLNCTSGTDPSIAYGCEGLVIPLFVSLIERVFEHARDRVIVFCDYKDKAIEARDSRLPA